MSLFPSRKSKFYLAVLVLSGSFLFSLSDIKPAQALYSTSTYQKLYSEVLTAEEWNNLFRDFVNTWLPVSLNGPVGIATPAPAAGLSVNGPILATGNVGIGATNPTAKLDVIPSSGNYALLAGSYKIGNVALPLIASDAATKGYVDSLLGAGSLPSATIGQTMRYDGASWISNSLLYNNGTNIGIGITNPGAKLEIVPASGNYALLAGSYKIGNVALPTVDADAATKGYVDSFVASSIATATGSIATLWGGTTVGNVWSLNSGNVGIGTTTPGSKFHIQGGALQINNASSNGGAVVKLLGSNTNKNWMISNQQNFAGLEITPSTVAGGSTFTTPALLINDSGNVGINTTGPGRLFDVNGISRFRDSLYFGAADDKGLISWGGSPEGLVVRGSTAKALYLGSNNTNQVTIDTAGNVGVGTTNPVIQLDVSSGSNFKQLALRNTYGSQVMWAGSVADTVGSFIANNAYYTSSYWFKPNYSAASGINFRSDGGTEFFNDTGLTVGTDYLPTKRMTILSNGNIGIAKASPGATLDVTGSISSSGTVNGTGLCISGDCKVSWPSIVSAGGGNLWSGTTTGAIWNGNGTNNVGIGTTNPGAKFNIVQGGDYNSGTVAAIIENGGANRSTLRMRTTSDHPSEIAFDVNSALRWMWSGRGASEGYQLNLYPQNSSPSYTSVNLAVLSILQSGNVGIGITNPTGKLQIADDTSSALKLGSSQTSIIGETDDVGYPGMKIAPYNSTIHFGISSNNNTKLAIWHNGTNYLYLQQNATTSVISNYSSNPLALQMHGGNVGVGTTAPGADVHIGSGGLGYIDRTRLVIQPPNHTGGPWKVNARDDATYAYLDFAYGANRHFTLNSSGNVGIAKTNPATTLDIVGSLSSTGTLNGTGLCISGDCKVSWAAVGSASAGWNRTAPYVYPATITDNVGIGITNPAANLVIQNTGANNTQLWLQNTGTGIAEIGFDASNGDFAGSDYMSLGQTDALDGYIKMFANAGRFHIDTAGVERLTVLQNGNVGVGVAGPDSKLNVFGTIGSGVLSPQEDLLHVGGNELGGIGGYAGIRIGGTTDSRYYNYIRSVKTTSYGNYWNSDLAFGVTRTGTANTFDEVLRVTSGGNVGVGTTAPSATLHVQNGGGGQVFRVTNASGSFGFGVDTLGGYAQASGGGGGMWFYNSAGSGYIGVNGAGNIGIAKTNPTTTLDIVGSLSSTGTLNGTGLCISGDCKVSWAAVGSASAGWNRTAPYVYPATLTDNVGIGMTNPTRKLEISAGASYPLEVYSSQRYLMGLRNTGDTGGGWWIGDEATGDFFLHENGVGDRITVQNATGNVGIGTTAPNFKLTVSGVTGSSQYYSDSTNVETVSGTYTPTKIVYAFNEGRGLGYNAADDRIFFAMNEGIPMVIDNSGAVGIGTTTPTYGKLQISGGNIVVNRPVNKIDNASVSELPAFEINNSFTAGQAGYVRVYYPTYNNLLFGADYDGNIGGAQPNIQFGRVSTPYLTIVNNGASLGNVGIGKTNPAAALDIVGSLSSTGTLNGTGLCISGDCKVSWAAIGAASSGWSQNVNEVYKTATAGNVGIGMTNPGYKLAVTGSAQIMGGGIDSTLGDSIIFSNTGYQASYFNKIRNSHSSAAAQSFMTFELSTGAATTAEVLRLQGNGNVGIGVVNPQALLHVAGEMVVNSGNWYAGRNAGGTNQPLLRSRGAGYQQTSYPGVQLGQVGDHIAMFIDPVSVVGGSFNGNLNEIFLPNNVRFLQADSAGTNWLYSGGGTLVLDNGNVGIGTSTPTAKLEIAQTTNSGIRVIKSQNSTAATLAETRTYNAFAYDFLRGGSNTGFYITNVNTNVPAIQVVDSSNVAGNLALQPYGGNIGIAKSNPGSTLDVTGSINASGTVNGTGLCIGGDCKASWAAVGGASSGWTQNGTALYKTDVNGNVGVGTTAPGAKLYIQTGASGTEVPLDIYGYRTAAPAGVTRLASITQIGTYGQGVLDLYNSAQVSAVHLATDGNSYIVPQNAGNVGIGTTAPVSKLHIEGDAIANGIGLGTGGLQKLYADGANYLRTNSGLEVDGNLTVAATRGLYFDGGSNTYMKETSGDNLDIFTGGTQRLRIDSSGNVGVGLTNPEAKLQISGGNGQRLEISNSGMGNNQDYGAIVWKNPASTVLGNIALLGNPDSDVSGWARMSLGTRPNNSATTLIESLTIQASGNVGIAKTNPATTLDIVGSLSSTGTLNGTGLCISGDCKVSWAAVGSASAGWNRTAPYVYPATLTDNVGIGITNPVAPLNTYATPTAGFVEQIRVGGTSNYPSLTMGTYGTYGGYIATYGNEMYLYAGNWRTVGNTATEDHRMYFHTSKSGSTDWSTPKMTLNQDGNLGIGISNPAYKLQVIGSTGLAISHDTTPRLNIYTDGSRNYFTGLSGQGHRFTTSGGAIFEIQNGGNVGIGTTAPGEKLTIQDGSIFLTTPGSGNPTIAIADDGGINLAGFRLQYFNNTGSTNFDEIYDNASAGLFFRNRTGGTALNTLSLVNGNVGVSKTNPATTLDVVGGISSTGTVNGTGLCISGDCKVSWAAVGAASSGWSQNGTEVYKTNTAGSVGIGTTAPYLGKLHINASGASTNLTAIPTADQVNISYGYNGANSWIFRESYAADNWGLFHNNDNNTFDFVGSSASRLHVNLSTGSIGIGTTAPGSRLDIVGDGSSNIFRVSSSPGAYRFRIDQNYDMFFSNSSQGTTAFIKNDGSAHFGGNVGIGTTAPYANLEVNGDLAYKSGRADNLVQDPQFAQDAVWWGRTSNVTYVYQNLPDGSRVRAARTVTSGVGNTAETYTQGKRIKIDPKKTYRVSVWMKGEGGGNGGTKYLGINTYNASGAETSVYNTAGTGTTNPYFHCGVLAGNDTWYKITGYIFASDTPNGWANPPDANGNSCNIGSPTARFDPTSEYLLIRFYNYSYNVGQQIVLFANPTIEEINSEKNIFAVNNNLTLGNGQNVGIAKTNPGTNLDIVGGISASGTVNGTGLCIGGDCKASWAAIGSASAGWNRTAPYIYPATLTDNVGIGITNPGTNKLHIYNGASGGTAYEAGGLVVEDSSRSSIQLLAPNSSDSYLFFGDASAANAGYVGHYGSAMSPANLMVYYSAGNHAFTGGNVGVGITAPAAKLHLETSGGITLPALDGSIRAIVEDATQASILVAAANNSNILFGDAASSVVGRLTYDHTNDSMQLWGAGAERLRINSGGNVGIGTTAPNGMLQVGNNLTAATLYLDNQSGYGSRGSKAWITYSASDTNQLTMSGGAGLTIHNNDTTDGNWSTLAFSSFEGAGGNNITPAAIRARTTNRTIGGWANGDLAFFTSPHSGLFERMRIDSQGNVGIAKTNPGATLDVVGGINSTGTLNGTGLCISGDCKVSWAAVGAASSGWSQNGNEVYKTATAGNVGIGTTNPTGKVSIFNNASDLILKLWDDRTAVSGDFISKIAFYDYANTESAYVGLRHNQYNGASPRALAFGVSGNEYMRINNSGNVGIGTTAPAYKLDIQGSAWNNIARIYSTGSSSGLEFYDTNGTRRGVAYSDSSGFGLLNSATSWAVRIPYGTGNVAIENGNLGVGVSNPTQKLDVVGNIELGAAVGTTRYIVTDETNTGTGKVTMQAGAGSAAFGGGINLYAQTHATNPGWVQVGIGSGAGSGATEGRFSVNNQGLGGGTDIFTVLRTGNVGIAKTNPGAVLDVVGGINSSGTVNGTGLCIAGDCKVSWAAVGAAGSGWSQNGNEVYKTNTAGNVGIGTTAPRGKLDVAWSGTDTGNIYFGDWTNGWAFGENVDASMRIYKTSNGTTLSPFLTILNGGNVGIGTTAPTQKLEVNGDVYATNYGTVPGNGYGYRFWTSDAYKLDMSNDAFHQYGTVTDYSLKMTMDNGAGRGFTWGRLNTVPIASLNAYTGNFQIAGSLKAANITQYYTTRTISLTGNDWVELGSISSNGSNQPLKYTVTINQHSNDHQDSVTYTGFNFVMTTSPNWVMVPPTNGISYNTRTTSLEAQQGSDIYTTKLRIRNLRGTSAAGTAYITIVVDNGTLTESSATGSGGTVVSGYAAGSTGWYFPVQSGGQYQASTNGLFIDPSGNVGIAKTNPGAVLDVVGGINSSGTVNGTGLCIAGDCKVSWAAVGSSITSSATNFVNSPDGDRNASARLPITYVRGVHYDFVNASTAGTGGNYAGVMTYSPYDGTTASTGDASYQLAFGSTAANGGGIPQLNIRKGIDSTWNSWYTIPLLQAAAGTQQTGNLNISGQGLFAGNIGIGTTAPNAKLDIYNGALVNSTSVGNHYRNVLTTYLGGSTQTGTLKIVLPKQSDTMIDITIKGYDYTGVGAWEARVSGYVYNATGGGWYTNNHKAQIIGSAPFGLIRLAYDGAKPVILLGTTSTTWAYGTVEVSDVSTSYGGIADWGSGWTASLITSETGLTTIATPTIYTYITPAGNVGIAKTNPATTLDIVGGLSSTGTINGTGLCISGDCKASWAAVGSASAGWNRTAPYVYPATLTDNVGIGITNPADKLVVSGASGMRLQNSTYDANLVFGASDAWKSGIRVWDNGDAEMRIWHANSLGQIVLATGYNGDEATTMPTDGLFIDQNKVGIGYASPAGATGKLVVNGNVGIGTTNPLAKLNLVGETAFTYPTIGTGAGVIHLNAPAANDSTAAITFGGAGTTNLGQAGIYVQSSGAYGTRMHFGTSGSYATGASARMTIDWTGNVGIAKTNPGATLDIVGGLNASGTVNGTGLCIGGDCKTSWSALGAASSGWTQNGNEIYKTNIAGNVGIGITNPSNKLQVDSGNIYLSGSTNKYIGFNSLSNWQYYLAISNDDFKMYDSTNTEFIKFTYNGGGVNKFASILGTLHTTNNGNVGISVTNPSQKLEVAGTIKKNSKIWGSKSIQVTTSWTTVLTLSLPTNHTSANVSLNYGGSDWCGHSAAPNYQAKFIVRNGAGGYGDPGSIISEFNDMGTQNDYFQSQIVNAGSGVFNIQIKINDGGDGFPCGSAPALPLEYEVDGNYASVS